MEGTLVVPPTQAMLESRITEVQFPGRFVRMIVNDG